MRDRARCAAQTAEQRQLHIYSKGAINSMPSEQSTDRPDYSKDVMNSTLSQQKRDKQGFVK